MFTNFDPPKTQKSRRTPHPKSQIQKFNFETPHFSIIFSTI